MNPHDEVINRGIMDRLRGVIDSYGGNVSMVRVPERLLGLDDFTAGYSTRNTYQDWVRLTQQHWRYRPHNEFVEYIYDYDEQSVTARHYNEINVPFTPNATHSDDFMVAYQTQATALAGRNSNNDLYA